jgi:flagellar hook-associated protein 1 FlgK
MSSNIFGLMNIAQSSLYTQQKAIDITGNNIANVNTPGYTRQRLNLIPKQPAISGGQLLGTGVTSEQGVQRFYDQFLGGQLNAQNEELGRWESQQDALQKIELMFDEVSGFGLSSAMSQYWNAWQDVANNPAGVVERTSLVSAGQYMTDTFNQVAESLNTLREDIDLHVDSIVDEVNSMARQIAELNNKITQQEVNGHNANTLRDERDQLAFNLAKMIDIQSFEDGDGHMSITVGNGKPLVERTSAWTLSTVDNGGVQNVLWQDSSGATVDITNQIDGGELKGWIQSRDVMLDDYSTRLDDLAVAVMAEVNALHAAGTTLDGVTTTGVDFFTGTNAGNITVNANIVANTDLIAAAGAGGAIPGDNSNAILIANLQSDSTLMPGNSTFDDFFNALVGDIGSDVQAAGFNHDHQTTMVDSLENYRLEVSGVSLDEEMVNLIQHQHAYNAAAKMINAADEMLSALMGILN